MWVTLTIWALLGIALGQFLIAGMGFMFGLGMVLSLLFGPEMDMPFTGYWPNFATAITLLGAIWPASAVFDKLYIKVERLSADQVFARNKPLP